MASITDRIAVAAKALVGVFSEDSAKQAFGLLQGIFPGSAGSPPQKGARERVAAFADMPWLHALADKVAFAFAAVEWTLSVRKRGNERAVRMKSIQHASLAERKRSLAALKQSGELVRLEEHPLLDKVLGGGNSFMTGLGVRYVTSLHMDLEGEAFWLKERDGLGVVVGAWPLPPDWVRAMPTPASRSYRVGFRGWQGAIPDTEILWLPRHNPSNPYGRGTGLARALGDELETDEMAAKHSRQVFFNMNRPDFIVYPKAPATWNDAERQRLQHDWRSQHEGFWRAMKARFASREIGIYEFGEQNFRNLQMVQLREYESALIRQVWGVPPEIMGIVEPGASRATIAKAGYIFATYVLVPRLEMFRALLQERLIPEYDDRLILDYVSPVEEDREFALEAGRVAPYTMRVDEWRELQGQEPLPDEAGRSFLVPFNLVPMEDFGGGGNGAGAAAAAWQEARNEAPVRKDEEAILRRVALEYLSGGGGAERMAGAVIGLAQAVGSQPPPGAPVVHVAAPSVTVTPPSVTVNVPPPPRPGRRQLRVRRDARGLLTDIEAVEEDAGGGTDGGQS